MKTYSNKLMKFVNTFKTLPQDLFAGTVVFLVALPLCLGIANASGAEPFAGLLAGVIGGLVIAVLSGSPLSVSGPAAGLIVIVVDGAARVGSFPAFLTAVLLAGALQFAFGLLKAGRYVSYIPSSVVKGMLAAIGLLLIIKQVPVVLGRVVESGSSSAEGGAGLLIDTPLGPHSLMAIGVGAASLAILFAWDAKSMRRFAVVRAMPGPLVVVALGILVTLGFDAFAPQYAPLTEHRVSLPSIDSFAALGAALTMPSLEQVASVEVWRLALTLAVVASLETLLSLEAVEQIDPKRRPTQPDRELRAQGIGNMIAGALGALPLTSVIVRSSANIHAGAQTRMSAIVHGVLLLASVFVLTGVLNLIPLACLAAILIATGYKLAKPSLFRDVASEGVDAFVPFITTIAGVLATDLLIGIVLGIACSLILTLRSSLRRPFIVAKHDDHVLLSFRKDISFLAKVELKQHLAQISGNTTVIVDATRADFVDPDVRKLIDGFAANGADKGIAVQYVCASSSA